MTGRKRTMHPVCPKKVRSSSILNRGRRSLDAVGSVLWVYQSGCAYAFISFLFRSPDRDIIPPGIGLHSFTSLHRGVGHIKSTGKILIRLCWQASVRQSLQTSTHPILQSIKHYQNGQHQGRQLPALRLLRPRCKFAFPMLGLTQQNRARLTWLK